MHLFYQEFLQNDFYKLENEEHNHCSRVLRHKTGDFITITDGKGLLANARITAVGKKETLFELIKKELIPKKSFYVHIGISPTKQMERMEWFVEKASELGIDEVTFIKTENSERPALKLERLEKKTISALKQSKGAYKTIINPMTGIDKFLKSVNADIKLIAAVNPKSSYITDSIRPNASVSILIGPEGDFSNEELMLAKSNDFTSISLGNKTLRTETAGIIAGQFCNMINRY